MKTLLLLLVASIASAQTTTQMVFPTAGGFVGMQPSPSADVLRCVGYVSPFTVSAATKLTFGVTTAGGTCAMGLYDSTGNYMMGANTSCTSTGFKVTTTSPSSSITVGHLYYLCTCSSSTSTRVEGIDEFASANMTLADLLNEGGARVGTAAETCTSGTLPPTITIPITKSVFEPPAAVIE